jgi:hypothetical protein
MRLNVVCQRGRLDAALLAAERAQWFQTQL